MSKSGHCTLSKPVYCIDTSVLLENTPLVKFIRNHIQDLSGVFSIDIDDFTLINLSVSLKLY